MAQASVGGYNGISVVSVSGNNAQVIKAAPGVLGVCCALNVNASPRYIKIYDASGTPTPSSMTPIFVVSLPGNTSGAGSNVPFSNLLFGNGIAFAIVSGIAANDNTSVGAGDCVVSFEYR